MGNNSLPTKFLPADRSLPDEIEKQKDSLMETPFVQMLIDAIPLIVLVLNNNRQIVLSNHQVLTLNGMDSIDSVLGLRPGELVNCIHAKETESGCGTTEFCSVCGAANAILAGQKGYPDVKDCRINTAIGGALDLRVWTTPFKITAEDFVLFIVSDITDEKRRRALERIFFHDTMNSLSAIKTASEILKEAPPDNIKEISDIIFRANERVISEINSQKELAAAESGELIPKPVKLKSIEVLQELIALYAKHELANDKQLVLAPDSGNILFINDEALILRVIGNMVKNALEASRKDDIITLASKRIKNKVQFSVHNSGFIPEKAQLQIFQRSFTTKGTGRGLGTYSMRLLSERYLKGNVSFTSSEKDGTTFYANYPV